MQQTKTTKDHHPASHMYEYCIDCMYKLDKEFRNWMIKNDIEFDGQIIDLQFLDFLQSEYKYTTKTLETSGKMAEVLDAFIHYLNNYKYATNN